MFLKTVSKVRLPLEGGSHSQVYGVHVYDDFRSFDDSVKTLLAE